MQNITILILSILGIAITTYINLAHILKKKVICPVNSKSCNIVLDSKYSRTLGIKNEAIGLAYYIAIIIAVFVINSPSIIYSVKVASGLAMLYSIILLGIQTKVLKNYCSWCIITAIINISIFVFIIVI